MRLAPILALAALLCTVAPAGAHPHVWVTTRSVILFGEGGRVTGIRHRWTFDEGYSAFAVQGLESKPGEGPAADKLAELAKINVESLAESRFFTFAKANGQKLQLGDAVNTSVVWDGRRLTLGFDLTLPVAARADRAFVLEVYDPTFFVDFSLSDEPDAVTLDGAPKGCALSFSRPKPKDAAPAAGLGESFFSALKSTSEFGAQFTSRALVACP